MKEYNSIKTPQNPGNAEVAASNKKSSLPKRVVWRPSSLHVDSGSESHPLLSSDGSYSSQSNEHPCSIFDSETSDFEAAPTVPQKVPQKKDVGLSPYSRSPFSNRGLDTTHRYGLDLDLAFSGYVGSVGGGGAFGSGSGGGNGENVGLRGGGGVGGGGNFFGVNTLKQKCSHDWIPFYSQKGLRLVDDLSLSDSDISIPGKNSSLVTIFSVWNTTVGTSLLALPWGIQQAGLLMGSFITFAMAGLCLYTAWRLLEIYRRHGTDVEGDVAEVSKKLLGPWGEFVARLFSMVVLLGATLIYWILMSNFLYFSVRVIYEKFTNEPSLTTPSPHGACIISDGRFRLEEPETSFNLGKNVTGIPEDIFAQYWTLFGTVPFYLVVLVGPLLCFSSTFFARFNALGTLCVVYLMVFVLVKSSDYGVNINLTDTASPFYIPMIRWSFPATTGLFAMSFFIHNIIISIMRNNRSQKNNGRDLSIAYLLVTLTYIFTGVLFYICFPKAKSCISDNLLNNFEMDDPMTIAARLFLFFQLLSVYPLVSSLMRSQFFMWTWGFPSPGGLPAFLFNTTLLSLCVIFAVFLPHIGTVIRYTGALSGLVYIFTLPPLLHLRSLNRRGRLTTKSLLFHSVIPVFGLLNLLAQFFVTS